MKIEEICDLVGELAVLRFFPNEPAARIAVARLIGEIANNDEEIRWLIRRMTSGIYNIWPGLAEMRACFCQRFHPRDGLEVWSGVFPDNQLPIDPEAPARRSIEAPELAALPPGHAVTADEELDNAIIIAAISKEMPKPAPADRFTEVLKDLSTAPCDREPLPPPTPQVITQADIDRAVAESRARGGWKPMEGSC